MSKRSLAPEWRKVQAETTRYDGLAKACRTLSLVNMRLVAEVLMLRTFLLLENTVASTSAKVVCGTAYLDLSAPVLNTKASSIATAETQMKNFGRTKSVPFLKWTNEPAIRGNLQYVVAATDPVFTVLAAFANQLDEMRIVRNHIAHGTPNTKRQFTKIVVQYYGAAKPGVTPGSFLLSRRIGAMPPIERYLVEARALVRALVRA